MSCAITRQSDKKGQMAFRIGLRWKMINGLL